MSRHVLEALGKARVIVEDGKVVEVGDPQIDYCPVFKRHRNIDQFDKEAIRKSIEFRIQDFGMCCEGRQMRMDDFLSFGVSELIRLGIEREYLDGAVMVCDGAGSCLVDDPAMVQGVGGRVSGIIETEPIDSVIKALGADNVLNPKTGDIDQFSMTGKAFQMGYRKLAVTVTEAQDACMIRDAYGPFVRIFAVHCTGVNRQDAEMLFDNCDVVTSCASRPLRDVGAKRALLQAGTRIPIYAATEFGKMLIEERLEQIDRKAATGEDDPPRPTI